MIQRFLVSVLRSGLTEVSGDDRILEDLFQDDYELTDTEFAAIKDIFDTPPKVHHGYGRSEAEFPQYSLLLNNEQEVETYLGDDAGSVNDPEDEAYGADILSSLWEHHFEILCYAEHPDVVLYMYEVGKSIMLASFPTLQEQGIYDMSLSGSELSPPEMAWLPEHIFGRRLRFKCRREFQRKNRGAALGKAFAVRGIHVDKGGSPSDVGGVQTLVTITEDSSEE